MKQLFAACILSASLLVSACAVTPPIVLTHGAELVKVAKSDPTDNYVEVGPVSGTHGSGCGYFGYTGSYEGAVTLLKNNAYAMGGTFIQIFTITEPHLSAGCFDNTYKISGTAYKQTRATPSPIPIIEQSTSVDTVKRLRQVQALRDEKVITQQEFDQLKARLLKGE